MRIRIWPIWLPHPDEFRPRRRCMRFIDRTLGEDIGDWIEYVLEGQGRTPAARTALAWGMHSIRNRMRRLGRR